jgi:hypothetical protein
MSPTRLIMCSLLAATSATAHAQSSVPPNWAPQPVAAPADDLPRVALTFSPIHLVVPMAELALELRLSPQLGVAVIGGVGANRVEITDELIMLYEAGISPRYYVLGSFRHGLQVGGEVLYVHAVADDYTGADIRAAGLGLSPYLGYKWTHRSGFTFEAQGGVSFIAIRGKGQASSTAKDDIGPLLNLQVGWSF